MLGYFTPKFATKIQCDWDSVRQEQGDISRHYSGSHLDLSRKKQELTQLPNKYDGSKSQK